VKQKLTIQNTVTGRETSLLLDRSTGRLSKRQVREVFQKIALPGMTVEGQPVGPLGEWPIHQKPPEVPDTLYHVVQRGDPDPEKWGMSNLFFVPVSADEAGVAEPPAVAPKPARSRRAKQETARPVRARAGAR
jgi:hypothetical protein